MMKHQNIIDGDGSWQLKLEQSRCPKCGNNLTLNKMVGKLLCHVCGLEIVDSSMLSDKISDSNRESEMETHLMPDEASIADKEPRMQWQEAVTTIDKVIEHWLCDERPVIGRIEGDLADEVRNAWHRILQG